MTTDLYASQKRYHMRVQAERNEIGPLPEPVDPVRRAACRLDLLAFLVAYFPYTTGLQPFGADHEAMVRNMEACILAGGKAVNAMYRGGAKSTISENAAIWALLYGHRRFVAVLALNKKLSDSAVNSVRAELAGNELLAGDFPEVCLPVVALDGKPQRCGSQTLDGERTQMVWRGDTLMLPTVAGSVASAGVFVAIPFKKARGLRRKLPSGVQQRPDLYIIDDPQDDELARSPTQVGHAMDALRRDILRGGGHQATASCIVNATVIEADDMIEQLLGDPAWTGERIALVKKFPDSHETHWLGKYRDIRQDYDRGQAGSKQAAVRRANEYYAANREAMDAGAEVSWDHCYDPGQGEMSAIQHAYNILIDEGELAFAAECQNQPHRPELEGSVMVTAEVIISRAIRLPVGVVPQSANLLTAFVDVHDRILYWAVCAFSRDFSGHVVAYGSWPQQKIRRYISSRCPRPLGKHYLGRSKEAAITAGLADLSADLIGREWLNEGGVAMHLGLMLIDSGYEAALVEEFARRSQHAGMILPSKGYGVTAGRQPMTEWTRREGQRWGLNWFIGANKANTQRVARYDSNWWKAFLHARLGSEIGEPGGLTLHAGHHEMFAEHLTAERPTKTYGYGRDVYEWRVVPSRPENHWLDCLVGSLVAASMMGAALPSMQPVRRPKVKRRGPKITTLKS
ncbi:MAG TPA: terminase gpA endonuclease subunit [Phycisphaerae bacterium]|nr:terminase gpA endonuclease subunit [Phycisphaerae bacterium]